MYKWVSTYWPWAVYLLAAITAVFMIVNWNTWEVSQLFCGSIVVFLAFHVMEEWSLPGGFHYQYNLTMGGSDDPNAGPLNMLSDMVTNFGATVFYFVLTFIPLNNGFVLMAIFFGIAESVIHTVFGVKMLRRFRSSGKRAIYGPGTVTAYLYLVITASIGIPYLVSAGVDPAAWITLGILVVVTVGGFIRLPAVLLRRFSDKYAYPDAGYFDRFIANHR